MTIKVLIKRKIPGTVSGDLGLIFMEMRAAAMQQKGYVGGETLRRVDAPDECLIISRWQTVDDWTRWLISDERRRYQEKIDALTEGETKCEVYQN